MGYWIERPQFHFETHPAGGKVAAQRLIFKHREGLGP